MTEHLLALSVGPVQEFISAARRTRDLWFGSYLLSEISKSAAKVVQEDGGELIFPAPAGDLDLEPDSELNVANIILAKLSGPDPKAVAHKAKEAARKRWRQFANQVFQALMDDRVEIRTEIWQNQVDDVIEFYAAWVSHRPDLYSDDRARLMRLLAGRKNCRDFQPAKGYAGIPKSSLDGLRESVLSKAQKDESGRSRLRRLLRLADGEQLCAVGLVKRMAGSNPPYHRNRLLPNPPIRLVKRMAGSNPPYPSVARVAADPWIRGGRGENLRSLVDECERINRFNARQACAGSRDARGLVDECERINRFNSPDVIRRLDTSSERGHPHYSSFPFEGTVVYRSRHRELREEAAITEGDLQPLGAALGWLIKQAGEPPSPYLGILVADGDRMGEALSGLKSAEEHQQFSRRLSRFAGEARRIVHGHHGVLVYSGGDDVLAFVPVDQCLKCARALREKFGELPQDESAKTKTKTKTKLTLSVGLAIAHFMENLEDLLEYGRRAEKHAKRPKPEDRKQEDRDGLAVHLHKRGGGPVTVRANWSALDVDALDYRLAELAAWLNTGAISHRVATDLHQIARVYDAWPSGSVKAAIQSDTLRVLAAKQPRGVSAMDQVRQLIDRRVHDAASLRRLGDELLVARLIAEAMRQAGGQAISGQTADEEASR